MFKKPLGSLKTSAPLRSSDRRRLKQRVVESFQTSSEDGDLLVPDGILSVKFSTHLNEPGIAYLSTDGDPLWFSVGKGSDDLIPTIYTLWKRPDLLPFISTSPAVIPVLVGGADLMIPGVIHHTLPLQEDQLVSILEMNHEGDTVMTSSPLAVGRMAVSSAQLKVGGKGKAVHVFHTWKDHLWTMGSGGDPPAATSLRDQSATTEETAPHSIDHSDAQENTSNSPIDAMSNLTILDPPTSELPPTQLLLYTPQEVTTLLHTSMLQAISDGIPAPAFPIPATAFYTNHILPSRPALPASVLPALEFSKDPGNSSGVAEITIKTSSHKSLTTFLKSAEKASILTLKAPQKHSQQSELLITSVDQSHPSILGHHRHVTVRDVEDKAAKRALRAKEKESQGESLAVIEFWKPHQASSNLFDEMGGDTMAFYSLTQVKDLVNSYISSKSLTNPHNQAYINLDQTLATFLTKSAGKSKDKGTESELSNVEFIKKDELTKKILEKMQSWYEVRVGHGDPARKKGPLKPIQVTIKVRQGRKACTLITGFEPYLVVDAEEMAEELRKVCAGATSISPLPGKPANAGLEVLIQGKQAKAVIEYLTGRGIPKKWIEVADLTGKK